MRYVRDMIDMNYYWLVTVYCRELQELEPEPTATSRFLLCTSDAAEPSFSLVSDLISELRLAELPGVSVTTTDHRIGSVSGPLDKFISGTPTLQRHGLKAWLLK